MEKKLLFLYLILSKLSLNENVKNFYNDLCNRKKLQKIIYILQEFFPEISLQYSYNLYIYGPYSPSLTKDLIEIYNNYGEYNKIAEQYKLGEKIINDIENIQKLYENKYVENLDEIGRLELICTYHYLYKKTYNMHADKINKCKEYIETNKPHLKDFIDKVYEFLSNKNLLS